MEFAECKLCGNGVLLPFTGPGGHMVYFCTNCRARFSGYHEEPMFEGAPTFSEMATYSYRDSVETGESFTTGELINSYRTILEENPPIPTEGTVPECQLCSPELLLEYDHIDLCWMPVV